MKQDRKLATYELARGTAVGKYEIIRKIATGGMAEIYLAKSVGTAGFEKLVVLKRILPNVAEDPTFVQMFLDEARLAATLHHPNIADVYDVGEAEGTYFYAMEFVHGQDVRVIRLTTRQRNEPVPMAIALAIVHGAASALDYAHEKTSNDGKPLGLVHRDVSASNVMVSYDGAIKLLDFGIARAATSQHKTQTGTLKGKFPYMSPEQCKGMPMDRRSDLFSLGVVLYELTVGRRPFRGETDFAVMDQIVYKGAQPPSELVQGYPAQLDAMVMKLLDRSPSNRYATGNELIADLEAFIGENGLWVSSRPLGKYMRTIFADKIAAWELAEQEGVTLGEHVAESITPPADLLTPPSEFPALAPPGAASVGRAPGGPVSQAMTAVAPLWPTNATPRSMVAVAPSRPVAKAPPVVDARRSVPVAAQAAPEPGITDLASGAVYPDLRAGSRRTLWIGIAVLVIGIGAGAGYLLSATGPDVSPLPRERAPVDMTAAPGSDMATPRSGVAQPPPPEPNLPGTRPVVSPTKPPVPETKPVPQTKPPEPGAKPPVPESRPTGPTTRPPVHPAQPHPVTPVHRPPQPKNPDPDKEKPWDPNSPFLPQ